jgi:hypothetical protein
MKKLAVGVVFISTLWIRAFGQPPAAPSPHDVAAYVNHLMDVQVGFTKMVPPGWSIEAKEVLRQGRSGQDLVVQYHVFVKGAPSGTLFKEINWPVNQDKPDSPLEGISVGKDGILMCAGRTDEQCGDPTKHDDPIEFTFQPVKGEPARIAFQSPAGTIGTVLVPDPIESKNRGCTLSATRLTSRFELAFISGEGYPPNTDIHYRATSSVTNDLVIHSDEKGVIRFSLIGKPKAGEKTVTMKVKILESSCSPEISYESGKI